MFTDIEGSTAQWERSSEQMAERLSEHDSRLSLCVDDHKGSILKHTGDGIIASFTDAGAAVSCAISMQRSLADLEVDVDSLRIRIGVHAGPVLRREGDLFGPVLNRAARIMSAAHGGQIIVSDVVRAAAGDAGSSEFIDLGLHRLKGLSRPEQLFQVAAVGLRRDFPAPSTMNGSVGTLPIFPNEMVNRIAELEVLSALLRDSPVTTLVGPGGVGKTRLAMHAARRSGALAFPDGVWFVDLAPLSESGLVAATIAATLNVGKRPGEELEATLRDALSARDALLVMDNCESVHSEVGQVLGAILVNGGRSRVLCTSQLPLGIGSEAVVRVDPLATSPPHPHASLAEVRATPSVLLFEQRAARAQPGFAVNDANRAAVLAICQRLDGLPLALELAAARCQILSPGAIADRLDRRFSLLKSQQHSGRHRTLLATLEWSFDLLDDGEKAMLAMLGVFQAATDVLAIVAVTDMDELDVLDTLAGLVNRSMLTAVVSDAGVQYRLLETMRQFAVLRLGERVDVTEIRERYSAWFESLAADAAIHLLSDDAPRWLERLSSQYADVRTVILGLIERSPERAVEMLNNLADFWSTREFYPEVNQLFADAVRLVGDHPCAIMADSNRAQLEWNLGNNAEADSASLESLARAERLSSPRPILAVTRLMVIRCMRGDEAGAQVLADELYDELQFDPSSAHYVLGPLGVILTFLGQPDRGRAICEEGVAISRQFGPIRTATALMNLQVALGTSDAERSLSVAAEAAAIARVIRSPATEAHAHMAMANVHRSHRDSLEALRSSVAALPLLRDCGRRSWVVATVELAVRDLAAEEPDLAAVALGATVHLREVIEEPGTEVQLRYRQRNLDRLRERLGNERLEALLAEGRLLTLDQLVDSFVAAFDSFGSLPLGA